MRAVIQRVKEASVIINGDTFAKIGKGILLFAALKDDDSEKDMDYIVKKTLELRIFENDKGKFDHSLKELDLELLIVSQFTLYGDTKNGRRPSFTKAMNVRDASINFYQFIKKFKDAYPNRVQNGVFQAMMDISLINDGPVTILLDSEQTI
ncbi:D-tyrosyl-tRNA(Tyr) deacylase [bacterium]|nr:D-tyrosyl-tRNA(Tyr) deacylase [bacterium]